MRFEVEMLAFGNPGEIRVVNVPVQELPDPVMNKWGYLQKIYHYGQNDFQPQQHPSVSVGDVINVWNEKWLVRGIGFEKLTEEEYKNYLATPRLDRSILAMGSSEDK